MLAVFELDSQEEVELAIMWQSRSNHVDSQEEVELVVPNLWGLHHLPISHVA